MTKREIERGIRRVRKGNCILKTNLLKANKKTCTPYTQGGIKDYS
jgi:hypothetical protein